MRRLTSKKAGLGGLFIVIGVGNPPTSWTFTEGLVDDSRTWAGTLIFFVLSASKPTLCSLSSLRWASTSQGLNLPRLHPPSLQPFSLPLP